MTTSIRNITIIAHVDHGKTTLIDNLMKQSGSFRENQVVDERLMDSGELEKERGITILAKPASINWKNSRVNIIDTPGHRDFAAEVERVLSMADGALLLIDSAEGVMPQTKFVLAKALKQGLKPIVVINKLDKADQRANEVLDETFDLFVSLDANEDQLDFPVIYASGRSGWASNEIDGSRENLNPLLDLIIEHVKPAKFDNSKPFAMLSTLLYADNFLGRSLVGRISQGTAKANQQIKAINLKGEKINMMTMHAAKGLEFDVVFLPGWEEGLFPHQKSIEEKGHNGLEEERRLAYVGITRAKRNAIISFSMNRFYQGDWIDSMASRFIDELPEKYLEKNSFFEEEIDESQDFEFNQDFEVENETRSPGWIRYQKRIK